MQTLAPSAPSIAHAARHDAAGFLAEEIERRRALRYPPFSHLVRIVLAAESEPRLDDGGERARRSASPRRSPTAPTCSARRRCSGSATATAAAS